VKNKFKHFKGELPINSVGKIVLIIMIIAVVFLAFSRSFDSVISGFVDSIVYPEPSAK